jgi:dihydrofolate synthase/folylpolyglutamate synthase
MRPFKKSIFAQDKPPAALFQYAKNNSVNLLVHNNDYSVIRNAKTWNIKSKNIKIENIPNLKMIGDYQYNYAAASTVALAEILPECISDDIHIKEALCDTEISGRFQYLQKSPDVILDVAHNEDAAKSLARNIKNIGYKKIIAVLGILSDKDVYSIVEPFSSFINHWHIGTIDSERGMNADEIKFRINSSFKNSLSISTHSSISSAFISALNLQDKDTLILVYGSFYTVSEVLKSNIISVSKSDAI